MSAAKSSVPCYEVSDLCECTHFFSHAKLDDLYSALNDGRLVTLLISTESIDVTGHRITFGHKAFMLTLFKAVSNIAFASS